MERKIKYLCPVCFQDSGIDLISYPESKSFISKYVKFKENVDESAKSAINVDIFLDFRGKCKYCDYYVTYIDIDEGIADIIQYLNSIGYNTIYSCEGHIKDNDNFDCAYLIFECEWDDKMYYEMIVNCPESWYIFKSDLSKPNNYTFNNEFRLYCKNPIKYPHYLQDLKDYIYNHFPKLTSNLKK